MTILDYQGEMEQVALKIRGHFVLLQCIDIFS